MNSEAALTKMSPDRNEPSMINSISVPKKSQRLFDACRGSDTKMPFGWSSEVSRVMEYEM